MTRITSFISSLTAALLIAVLAAANVALAQDPVKVQDEHVNIQDEHVNIQHELAQQNDPTTAETHTALESADTHSPRQPVTVAASLLPHDLSPWGMFLQADWVVKTVMIGLLLASIATWTVLVAKTSELRSLVKRQRRTLDIIANAESLKNAHEQLDEKQHNTELTRIAAQELHLSAAALADGDGVKERVASSLERLEAAAGRTITKGTSILATIGSTAPFVGLFGTVWGIMNSFIGIAETQTTNLAVVAPGIAEALLATAIGLVAAIPAVVTYNHFARQIAAYKALVGDSSAAVLRLVSRDLSRYAVNAQPPARMSVVGEV